MITSLLEIDFLTIRMRNIMLATIGGFLSMRPYRLRQDLLKRYPAGTKRNSTDTKTNKTSYYSFPSNNVTKSMYWSMRTNILLLHHKKKRLCKYLFPTLQMWILCPSNHAFFLSRVGWSFKFVSAFWEPFESFNFLINSLKIPFNI